VRDLEQAARDEAERQSRQALKLKVRAFVVVCAFPL
jgi:hypothetical protein